jgi:hypothetical protein
MMDAREGGRPMKALIADQKLVTELLPMDEDIAVMRRALTMLAEGDIVMPLREMLAMSGGERVCECQGAPPGRVARDRQPAFRQRRRGLRR